MSATPPDRLAAELEVGAFLRLAAAQGGFGTVIHKGDASRGSVLLMVLERGVHAAILERTLQPDGHYGWSETGPGRADSHQLDQYVARRRRSDPDCWIIELDVPLSQPFIAETISAT